MNMIIVENFLQMMEDSINEGKAVCVSGEHNDSHFIISVVPDVIKADNGFYFEGEGLILRIYGDYEIEYDDLEEMYIVMQGEVKYYFA